MKTRVFILLPLLFAVLITGSSYTSEPSVDVKEIIRKADANVRGKTSQGTMKMIIKRPKWERTITMKTWSKADDHFMIYIKSPADSKGQVFMKRTSVDKNDKKKIEMWNWVPSIQKMMKIPPSMMMQSWMGSDFTNDDLVSQSSIVDDYTHTLLSSTDTIRGRACYKIKLVPKKSAKVVWGKIYMWVSKEGYHMIKSKYYNEVGKLINTENAYNIKKMNDRSIATKMVIKPYKKKQSTTLIIEKMVFNKPIDDSFFTKQNMKKVK